MRKRREKLRAIQFNCRHCRKYWMPVVSQMSWESLPVVIQLLCPYCKMEKKDE